ncbi:hypothetical protein [Clostridium septicum]|uniref:Uncharacterized protein n=1 Tax=Clostridium septicum TaxID=1504 RepID=A0A9N7PMM6_CLOSE|nr:hypothetical protein [Clostridium septicum]AYE35327.1 hypothetical protein CP523_13320 [Clostridium septicum]UEC20017.1 hypothetical protein LK444_11455 [Clostridium septicum]USS01926.1 hypothetical protein NH397_05715 [Clostridium septicum]
MYIYYKINKNNIYDILSSLTININDDFVYSVPPSINEDEVVIKIKITYDEKCGLIKIDKECYRFNKILNIENRIIVFYFLNESMKNKILNNLKYIKEIKVNYEYIENNFKIYYWKNGDTLKIITSKNNIEIVKEKNQMLFNRILSIKGIIYGMFTHKQIINKYVLNNCSKVYEEYSIINNIIINLRNKNELNRKLYNSLIDTRNVFRKQIENNLNNFDYKNILITDIDYNYIKFNNCLLNLSLKDLELFERIINYIVNKLSGIEDEKKKTLMLLKYLDKNKNDFEIKEDYELLHKRIVKEDYSVNVDSIKNDVIKNIYVVFIKYDSTKEFVLFTREKNIRKSYIAYMTLGAIKGLKYMSGNIIAENVLNDGILKNSIKIVDDVINGENQRYLYKLKLHYYLNKLYSKLDNIKVKFDDFDIITNKEIGYMSINIKRENALLEVFYKERKKKLANSIKYYDNRCYKLKKIKMECPNNNIYFNYRFIINNKTRTLDLRYEYIFSNLLEYINNKEVE